MRYAILLVGVLMFATCGGSGSTSYATTAAMRDRLVAKGIDCTAYKEITAETGTAAEASCTLFGRPTPLIVFHDARELETYVGSNCAVTGEHWAVIPVGMTSDQRQQIAAALDAKNC